MKLFSLLLLTFALFSCKPKVDYPKDNSTPRPTLEKDGWEIIREDNIVRPEKYPPNKNYSGELVGFFLSAKYSGESTFENFPKIGQKVLIYVDKKLKEKQFHSNPWLYQVPYEGECGGIVSDRCIGWTILDKELGQPGENLTGLKKDIDTKAIFTDFEERLKEYPKVMQEFFEEGEVTFFSNNAVMGIDFHVQEKTLEFYFYERADL